MKSLFFSSIAAVVMAIFVFVFAFILIMAMTMATVMPIVNAEEEIRISSISDSLIGKEVTVSGVIVALSNNIEPSTSTEGGIQTYEPGDTGVLTIYDGTDTIFVSSDPGLLEKFYEGQRVMVTGIYAGKDGITETKGIIYADAVSTDREGGYKDVTIKELKEFPEYYYSKQVRIKGTVTRIEIISGETELEIDDGSGSGTMPVEYRAEIEDIKIGDEVAVEGKFYRNKIYAFAVKAEMQKPEPEPEKTPEPGPSPSPSPISTPTPAPTPTPSPSPTPVEAGGVSIGMFHLPLYLVVIIIAVAAVAGVFIAFKVREWLMLKRYGG